MAKIKLDALNPTPPSATGPLVPSRERLAPPKSLYAIKGRYAVTPERVNASLVYLDTGRFEMLADLISQMHTDPVVRRAYEIRRGAVAGRKWTVSAPENVREGLRDEAERLAKLTEKWLLNLDHLESFLMRVLDAIGPGVSAHELIWNLEDGYWLPTPAAIMTREIMYERDWTLAVRNNEYVWVNTADHPGKFLVHNPYTVPTRPIDQGCFLATVWYWLFKRGGMTFWMNGAERFGNPLILARMATASDLNQRTQMLNELQQLTSDSVGVLTGASSVDILDAKASGSTTVWSELMKKLDEQIFLSIGVSPDLLLSGPNGSRSATETRDGVRLENSKMDARLMWAAIIDQCVRYIAHYNRFNPDVPMPVIQSVFDDNPEIPESLIKCGAVTVNEVRAGMGLPLWTEGQGGHRIASFEDPVVNEPPVPPPTPTPDTTLTQDALISAE